MPSLSSPYSDTDSVRSARLLPIGDIMPALLARYDLEWPVDWSVVSRVDSSGSWQQDELAAGQAVSE